MADKRTQAEKDFEKIIEDIAMESGSLFGDDGNEREQIRLLEAQLLTALQERDQWRETAEKHQTND